MQDLLSTLSSFALAPVANGYVVALALVCLLQYCNHLFNRGRLTWQTKTLRREVDDMCLEMRDISRDRTISRLENQILRDILGQAEFSKSLDAMLRRFVPNPEQDFVAIVQLDASNEVTSQCRGLESESANQLMIDPELVNRLRSEKSIELHGADLQRSKLYSGLTNADRRKADELFLLGVGDLSELFAVLVTTRLIGVGGDKSEQLELSKRLMSTIAGSLRQSIALLRQSQQLQFTREMLELKTIADSSFDQPMRMIERFLSRLTELVEAKRAVLFLVGRSLQDPPKILLQTGDALPNNYEQTWEQHEASLAKVGLVYNQMTLFERSQLVRFQIDSLIGSAITVPLIHGGRTIGLMCITRTQDSSFSPVRRQLISWAGDTLSVTIHNAVSYAAIERQARQDGLTGLANRRTFDLLLAREMDRIQTGNLSDCALLLLDLDRFKSINDTHGHQAGDEVLRETSRILREQTARIRSTDRIVLARYGGEELAALLPGINAQGALRIAESLREAVEDQPILHGGACIHVTMSVGVAVAPLHAECAEQLLTAADSALYRAKSSGRNQVCLASPAEEMAS